MGRSARRIGSIFYLFNAQKYVEELQWFPKIEPELNVYYTRFKNQGAVYRFGSAAFNDLSYNMPIRSTRLMLDAALTVASWHQFSTYVIGGLGNAWNRVSYSDSFNGVGCNTQNLRLKDNNSSNFVWEAGAGVAYTFNDMVGFSFQYLYTDFGKLMTGNSGNISGLTTPSISPANVNLHTQALMLGMHLAVG